MNGSELPNGRHAQVRHPADLMPAHHHRLTAWNEWAASHLSAVFGLAWTIWAFMVFPVVLLAVPEGIRETGFFISSGWIQLWALPLFIYVGNLLQKKADAQADAVYQALTHIAHTVDENSILLRKVINGDVQPLPPGAGEGMAQGD